MRGRAGERRAAAGSEGGERAGRGGAGAAAQGGHSWELEGLGATG